MLLSKYGRISNDDNDFCALHKGSYLYKEFERKQKFYNHKSEIHDKLRNHIKQKAIASIPIKDT